MPRCLILLLHRILIAITEYRLPVRHALRAGHGAAEIMALICFAAKEITAEVLIFG